MKTEKLAENPMQHSSLHSSTVPKITIADLQNISTYADLLLRSSHVLKLNMEVLKMLSRESKRAEDLDSPDSYSRYRTLEWALDSTMSETKLLRDHAELVLSRAKNVAAMVSDIICFEDLPMTDDVGVDERSYIHSRQRKHAGYCEEY